MRIIHLLIALFLSICFCGCLHHNNEIVKTESNDNPTLRILFPVYGWDNNLSNVLESNFPDINFEMVYLPQKFENPLEGFMQFLKHENIDIVFPGLDGLFYQILARDGYLYPLDHFMMDPDFKLEEIHPGVLQQYQVDGEVFGLSPYFYTHVIYYNKDIFEQLDIDPPIDQMTWMEVFDLASELTVRDEEVTGLSLTFPYVFFQHFAVQHDLRYFQDDGSEIKIVMDNEEWSKAWEIIYNGIKGGYLDFDLGRNGFLEGHVAMIFDSGIFGFEDRVKFDWDIVTEPIHPSNRNESISISPSNPASINKHSDNVELAWQVIKYLNSSEVAAELTEEEELQLLSRATYINVEQDFNANAYLSLKRGNRHYDDVFKEMPSLFNFKSFTSFILDELDLVIAGRITIDEALEKLQTIGEELQYEALNNERGKE